MLVLIPVGDTHCTTPLVRLFDLVLIENKSVRLRSTARETVLIYFRIQLCTRVKQDVVNRNDNTSCPIVPQKVS